ncbi:F-box domain, Leucine-rich repeat domain, L domain-like protein [Artemisia annua]|uniref:F-box domain, Leucine-rich repeat domain, L domain-like protein n=1 Tax=Artemisia annua TaxID=35608 RepID=A0A2U1NKI1_ARTAN|nr:F-box domain, Leucine-rich repeat domain, L domain-like protein [Artemisia annua]
MKPFPFLVRFIAFQTVSGRFPFRNVMESKTVEDIMDSRLSSLPDNIIHKILSTVNMKDVIKTSVLSSRWRYIWTSMPYLNFSNEFSTWHNQVIGEFFPKFTQFVEHVLSHRNNQVPVSSVKLIFHGDVSSGNVERIMKYILSHSVQQMDVEYFFFTDHSRWLDDSYSVLVTLFSSRSLKRLSLTMGQKQYLTASSTLELPALMTLYLSCVELYHGDNTLFSKCPNLKNLTLKSCKMKGLDSLSICHHRLSNLTLEDEWRSVKVVNVVAPQLDSLTIRYRFKEWGSDTDCLWKYKHEISAPNLISLIYEGDDPLALSTDGFHSLEKVDLCICSSSQEAAEALEIVRLFQQIQSVKFLTLNLEILELILIRDGQQHIPPTELEQRQRQPQQQFGKQAHDEGCTYSHSDPTTSAALERNIGRFFTGDPDLTAHDPAEDGASPATTAADHFFLGGSIL